MIARARWRGKDGDHRFAEPPWDEQTLRWQEIDESLPADHLARQIARAVEELDLSGLLETYSGRGSKAIPPGLLLRLILYEMQRGHPSPAEWHRDAKENEPAKWLLFGTIPSRALLYEFRDRVAEFWDEWMEQILRRASAVGVLRGDRAALDGTSIPALASRHRLINQETLAARLELLDQASTLDQQGKPIESLPGWMAKHPRTRENQRERYREAQSRMQELQANNGKRTPCKRKKPEKLVVCVSDPEAALARDKQKVFCPLYNVQVLYDLDSAFITAYELFACQNDAGAIEPVLERALEFVGRKPRILLTDTGYTGGPDLAICEQAGVTLYAPVRDMAPKEPSRARRKPPQIPKKDFTWLAEQQTYRCPEGHLLVRQTTIARERLNGPPVAQTAYRCPPEYCKTCARREACTPCPGTGRTISRQEDEELVEELRARMETAEAKELYKLRRQTIELRYADLKQHRRLRRFHSYGRRRARAEIGAAVLAYNLLVYLRSTNLPERVPGDARIPEKLAA